MTLLEIEAERLSDHVEQLKREKSGLESFAAAAAHEMIEPLIITEAYASMVHDRLDDVEHEESRRDLAALGRTASRARLLIEALLHDARTVEAGSFGEPVDLNAVVAECLDVLAPEIAARDANILVGPLPTVTGHGTLLSGLFANLLMNGLKYSRRHEPQIAIDAEPEAQAWRLSVTSFGPTIPPEDRERIFEPYQRGRGERRTRGAGLGLTICRRIVERHGGVISVVPARGGGNRFHFTLPA